MKVKHILFIISSILLFGLFTACKTISNGTGVSTVVTASTLIASDKQNISNNNMDKMENVGAFSYGTSLALNNIYNLSSFDTLPIDVKLSVDAAVVTNNYVRELSPSIDSSKMLEMEEYVKSLIGQLESAKNQSIVYEKNISDINKKGEMLEVKLAQSEQSFRDLTFTLGGKVDELSTSLQTEKSKTDKLEGELDKFDDGFGWYAIKHGLSVFFKKMMWITIGLTTAFLILKILATSNPIAASIFSAFESIVGFFIKGVFSLFPKAVKYSGNVDLPTFNTVKSTRDKLVDTIESLYRIEKSSPGKVYTLKEVFDELEKNMDVADKEEIKIALKKLGW